MKTSLFGQLVQRPMPIRSRCMMATLFLISATGCASLARTTVAERVMADDPPSLPDSLAAQHDSVRDPHVSDDFDDIDPARWVVRAAKGDPNEASGRIRADHNQIHQEGDTRYLSLLSSLDGEAGLSALHPYRYGFTVCRWRIRGMEVGRQYSAHPAIWSFSYNMGSDPREAPNPEGRPTLEIDWMEYIKWLIMPGFHARVIPAFDGISDVDQSVYMFQGRTDFDAWRTQGFEYSSEGVRMWEHGADGWYPLGRLITFADVTSDDDKTIIAESRSDQYFVLSNIWFGEERFENTPVRLDIDYLHHYPMQEDR